MIGMIQLYKLFWDTISEVEWNMEDVTKLCEKLLALRRSNKLKFVKLRLIFKFNKELEFLSFLYCNFITWEPLDRHTYRKRVEIMVRRCQTHDLGVYHLDLLDSASCVLGVNINSNDHNKIALCTNNTLKIFEVDRVNINSVRLDLVMPQMISKVHNSFIEEFKQNQTNTHMYDLVGAWALTAAKKAFFVKVVVKILIIDDKVFLIAYVKAICYKKYLILNDWGEIDCFGENFNVMTGIDYELCFSGCLLSIFMFMPALIPLFLGHFYDCADFSILNFDIKCLDTTYLFIFKNQNEKILELSKLLEKTMRNKRNYCKVLFDFMSAIEKKEILKVFQVKIEIQKYNFHKQHTKVNLIEMIFSEVFEVTEQFTEVNFAQNMIFVNKLNMTDDYLMSIKHYPRRFRVEKYESTGEMKSISTLIKYFPDGLKNQQKNPKRFESHKSIEETEVIPNIKIEKSGSVESESELVKKRTATLRHLHKDFSQKGSGEKVDASKLIYKLAEISEINNLEKCALKSKGGNIYRKFKATFGIKNDEIVSKFWSSLFEKVCFKLTTKISTESTDIAGELIRKIADRI